MTQYIQYDEMGNITASIISFCDTPDCARQIALAEPVDIAGKMVDTVNAVLMDRLATSISSLEREEE